MKLRTILNEIGDSAKVYDYDKSSIPKIQDTSDDSDDYPIYFRTDKNTEYKVTIFTVIADDNRFGVEVYFRTNDLRGRGSYSDQTNRYELFSVMATISDIVLNTVKKNRGKINFIQFSPTKTENDKDATPVDETQRGKLYMTYVKSKLSAAGIDYSYSAKGDKIFINILGTN